MYIYASLFCEVHIWVKSKGLGLTCLRKMGAAPERCSMVQFSTKSAKMTTKVPFYYSERLIELTKCTPML